MKQLNIVETQTVSGGSVPSGLLDPSKKRQQPLPWPELPSPVKEVDQPLAQTGPVTAPSDGGWTPPATLEA
jgi:hypothetical protein